MDKAFQDLVWLSERLSGIVSLKDEIKSYADIKNKTKELEKSSVKNAELLKELTAAQVAFNEGMKKDMIILEDTKKQAKAEAKDIVDKAIADAKAKGQKEKDVWTKSIDELSVKYSYLQAEEQTLKNRISELKTDIGTKEDTILRLSKEIDKLKSKFN